MCFLHRPPPWHTLSAPGARQTDALLAALGLPHAVTTPYRPAGQPAPGGGAGPGPLGLGGVGQRGLGPVPVQALGGRAAVRPPAPPPGPPPRGPEGPVEDGNEIDIDDIDEGAGRDSNEIDIDDIDEGADLGTDENTGEGAEKSPTGLWTAPKP